MDLNMANMIFARSFFFARSFRRKPKDKVRRLSRLQQDYMSSILRYELTILQNLLSSVENADRCNAWYFEESMKRLKRNIHCFKKVCSN